MLFKSMYIIYVNHDSVIKQICQLRDKAFLINETLMSRYDFQEFERKHLIKENRLQTKPQLASHAGVFRGARISSLPTQTPAQQRTTFLSHCCIRVVSD